MIPLLLAMLAGEVVKGGISAAEGIGEKAQANKLEKDNVRPTETVPQGVLDSVAYSKLMAMIGMPAEQFNAASRDINRSATNTIAAARDRRGAIDVLGTVQQNTNDATLNLEAKSAEMRTSNTQNYIQQLMAKGGWEDKVWQWNSAQKFEENAAAVRSLRTAGNANINTALNSVLSGAVTAATMGNNKNPVTSTSTDGTVAGNQATLNGGDPYKTPEDPTVTNPELFDNSTPLGLINYLQKVNNN